jgi:hypothetical protein
MHFALEFSSKCSCKSRRDYDFGGEQLGCLAFLAAIFWNKPIELLLGMT